MRKLYEVSISENTRRYCELNFLDRKAENGTTHSNRTLVIKQNRHVKFAHLEQISTDGHAKSYRIWSGRILQERQEPGSRALKSCESDGIRASKSEKAGIAYLLPSSGTLFGAAVILVASARNPGLPHGVEGRQAALRREGSRL